MKRTLAGLVAIGILLAGISFVLSASAAPYPYALGGTSTSTIPGAGQIASNNGTSFCYVPTSTTGYLLEQSSTAPCGVYWIPVPAITSVNGNTNTAQTLTGGTGISVSSANGNTTTTNIGVTSFTGQGCVTASNSTGTIGLTVSCISGNQNITFTLNGDATGTASGSTAITDTVKVTGLNNVALPANTTGTLQYSAGAWSINLATSSLGLYNASGLLSSYIGSSCGGGLFVTGFSASGTVACSAPSTSSNNATGTADEAAMFNATNTLISTQPDYVPSNFATVGCAGSSTATTINGCIQAIAAQEQANGASAATIYITHNVVPSTYPAPINLGTNAFPIQLECTAGVNLEYGGASQQTNKNGAIVFNFGNPSGHPALAEGAGCNLLNGTSFLYAGLSNNATDTGIYFGGNQGAVGIDWQGNVNGFGINYVMGQNAYMDEFTGTSSGGNGATLTPTGNTTNGSTTVSNVTSASNIPIGAYLYGTGIPQETTVVSETSSSIVMSNAATATNTGTTITVEWGSLGQYDTANNSGERPILAGTYTDPGNDYPNNALWIADGATADWFCNSVSLDDAQLHVGFSDGLVGCNQIHVENSDYSQYGQYIPIYAVSSQYTMLAFQQLSIAQDSGSGATTFNTIIKDGTNLYLGAVFINNYGGAPVTNLVDHSLNNGSESEQICDVQASGGTGLTNIVAGAGGNTYSNATGVGCSIDVDNSYTINIYPQQNNTNIISSGNTTVATFDHSGNWTFLGAINASSSLTVQGNTNIRGTLTDIGGNLYVTSTAPSTTIPTVYVSTINASGTNIFANNSGNSSTVWVNSNPTFNALTYTNASGTNESLSGYLQSQNIFDALGNKYVTSTSSGGGGITTSSASYYSYGSGNLPLFITSSTVGADAALNWSTSTKNLTLSSGTLTLAPDVVSDTFALGGRLAVGIPVPYLTPTATNTAIAFDLFPHGATTSNGFGSNIYGAAWEDICDTDIVASSTNYECLHLGKAKNDFANISTEQAGTGVIRPLIFQANGGNVAVGTALGTPTSTLTVNGTFSVQNTSTFIGPVLDASGNKYVTSTNTTNVSSTNIDVSNRLNVTNALTIPNNTTPSTTGELATENTSSSLLTFHDGTNLNALSPYYKCFDWVIFNASTTADTQDYVTTIYNTSTLVGVYQMNVGSSTMQYNLEWNMSSASTTAQDSHAFTATTTSNNVTSTFVAPTGSSTINSGYSLYFTASGPSVSSTQFGLTGICKVLP